MKCFLLSISVGFLLFASNFAAPGGMSACMAGHSFDTCHYALNR